MGSIRSNTTWMDGYRKGVHGKQGKRYGEINDNKDEIDNLFRPMTETVYICLKMVKFILINLVVENKEFTLINVYSSNSPKERKFFFNKMGNWI